LRACFATVGIFVYKAHEKRFGLRFRVSLDLSVFEPFVFGVPLSACPCSGFPVTALTLSLDLVLGAETTVKNRSGSTGGWTSPLD
jgi:hypothetical protein